MGNTSRQCKYSVTHNSFGHKFYHLLRLLAPKQLLMQCFRNGDFIFPSYFCIKDLLLLSIYLSVQLFMPVLARGSYFIVSSAYFPSPFVPSIFLPHPFLSLSLFLQSFFLLKKPSYFSHEVFLHWLWLSMSS